jgi:hypothetical protein
VPSLRWLALLVIALVAIVALIRGACAMEREVVTRADLPSSREPRLVPVGRARLHVTEGALTSADASRIRVEGARMRAVADGPTPAVAELRFTYLGPTREEAPLRSGELRRQIGLKLRARDGCNLVYAMWRLAPEPGVVVQVKSNPGKTASADCGNGGYRTVKPRRAARAPVLEQGSSHALRAELRGRELRVLADGEVAWEGALPDDAFAFDGPVGLRSDNGRFELELLATMA